MDRILLHDIRLTVHLGVPAEERSLSQEISADLDLLVSTRLAGESDDFQDTVDYAAVHRTVMDTATERPYALVEAMAERIAAAVLGGYAVQGVIVRIRKPAALAAVGVGFAGVEIERFRDG